jgi:hypothetical protein
MSNKEIQQYSMKIPPFATKLCVFSLLFYTALHVSSYKQAIFKCYLTNIVSLYYTQQDAKPENKKEIQVSYVNMSMRLSVDPFKSISLFFLRFHEIWYENHVTK